MEMVDNPELEAILNRISELEPQADEYDELVKSRDKILIQGHDVTCGNWIVQWNKVEKSFKPQPAKDGFTRTEWRKTIQRVA